MTIIVLIILATISIYAVLGENGIIAKAEHAKELQGQKTEEEEEKLNTLDEYIGNYMNGNGSGSGNGSGNGGSGGNNPTMPSTWDSTKVIAVTSEDNVVVPVPIGYTASTVTGEKSVATGFVIKQGNDGSLTSGINEFVWVPVSDITDLYDSANNAGQLWNFSGTTSTKQTYPPQNRVSREPDVVTGASSGSDSSSGNSYDAVPSNLQQAGLPSTATVADFKTQLQNEFTTMKNSVEKYGGFYIGRYETGNLSQATAVVQKNNSDISNQTWYTQYKLSKTIKANDNVVSSMIWGCQWDATMRWMQTSSNPEVVNYVTNSTGKGNYAGTQGSTNQKIATGSNPAYAVNNIYDMAGNVYDWTLEAYDTGGRIRRGGSYYNFDSDVPASTRNYGYPTNSSDDYGSRVTLYVAL